MADSGAIYALLDADDAWHQRVAAWWQRSGDRVVLPMAILPEVCFLLQRRLGAAAEVAFIDAVVAGEFECDAPAPDECAVIASALRRFADLPLGFVDAAVLAAAERRDASAILTTDRRHFTVARIGRARLLVP